MNHFEGPDGTHFHSNSDLSGDVIISENGVQYRVPGRDLLAFVANYVRDERIAALEHASDEEILRWPMR